jgi:acetyl-CoA carboxylase biotin carboxyl carrier protein
MSENFGSARSTEKKEQKLEGNKKPGASKKANQTTEPSLNMAELYELANLVDEHGFTDFEFENANIRVRLSKNPAPQIVQAVQPHAQISSASEPQQIDNSNKAIAQEDSATEAALSADVFVLTSPIVGTFYSAPSPDNDPYVKVGSKVSSETHVCIIEAMKLMNEIEAEQAGEIVKIYVENGQPVEYGQPLFGIKK